MPDADLDVLIIENLADFDAGARYLTEDLEPRVGAAMDVICKAFMKQNNWAGHSDWDEDETWLASEDWRVASGSGADDYRCKVQLEPVASLDGSEDEFWLTYLIGVGVQSLCLRWFRTDVRSKRAWRKAVAEQPEIIRSLRNQGFEYEEANGTFILPFRVDARKLMAALRDEVPGDGLEDLTQALEKLIAAKPTFDVLLSSSDI